ncbi:MAG: DEAD/DEAH box helicase family protein [Mobilitalea sp.]
MKNLAEQLISSVNTSLIDHRLESLEEYRPQLIFNDNTKGNVVLCSLEKELNECETFIFSIAFISMSGITVLIQTLKELAEKGIKGKILTTDYLCFNDPKALKKLLEFSNIELRVYTKEHFHTKGYIFRKEDRYTFVVGSSNLTQNALKKNKEWNLRITSLENGELIQDTLYEFNEMWNDAELLTLEWIQEYSIIFNQHKAKAKEQKIIRIKQHILKPNKMQIDATHNLKILRSQNKNKAILISATGTGKTYLSAFDARNYNPKKLLFLVHREQILKQAEDSFRDVLGELINTGFLTGNVKNLDADYLFSTVQTMSKDNVLSEFTPKHFDYIIIDETHKAGAESYHKIMNYFQPKFLLGMTATPERTDEFNVFELFDYNIAYEIRLQQAMKEDLLCPFHYFGITELTIDGNIIDDTANFSRLTSDERVNNIIEKINFYEYSGERVKGLIFCSRNEEAKELSQLFNGRGFQTISLSGSDSQDDKLNTRLLWKKRRKFRLPTC